MAPVIIIDGIISRPEGVMLSVSLQQSLYLIDHALEYFKFLLIVVVLIFFGIHPILTQVREGPLEAYDGIYSTVFRVDRSSNSSRGCGGRSTQSLHTRIVEPAPVSYLPL